MTNRYMLIRNQNNFFLKKKKNGKKRERETLPFARPGVRRCHTPASQNIKPLNHIFNIPKNNAKGGTDQNSIIRIE